MIFRYNSSRAKCIKCTICGLFFSPNKFIFHSHRTGPTAKYIQPDAANFNSWRRHMRISGNPPMEIVHAWEDVKVSTCHLVFLRDYLPLKFYRSCCQAHFARCCQLQLMEASHAHQRQPVYRDRARLGGRQGRHLSSGISYRSSSSQILPVLLPSIFS